MVGLPARGKTFISKKLCRYLNWIGIRTKVFNLGDYRRLICKYEGNEFFAPNNSEAAAVREQCARMALDDVFSFLDNGEGEVAIFDATNTTRARRHFLIEHFTNLHMFRVFFVESICDDPRIIEHNI
uniref:6-phosphofructo-2-kinase domain-containing protein n=1 Tax=Romanomermis culicivorax TaxID=13658 RepID=A0A915ICR9_ROMCU